MYEKCAYQVVPEPAERASLKESLLHHFVQDMEYYHTSTLSVEQQVELSVKMLFDPTLQEKWKEMQSTVTYNEQDVMDYKNFVRGQIEQRHPLATSKTSHVITPEHIRSFRKEFPVSEELNELLNKLER